MTIVWNLSWPGESQAYQNGTSKETVSLLSWCIIQPLVETACTYKDLCHLQLHWSFVDGYILYYEIWCARWETLYAFVWWGKPIEQEWLSHLWSQKKDWWDHEKSCPRWYNYMLPVSPTSRSLINITRWRRHLPRNSQVIWAPSPDCLTSKPCWDSQYPYRYMAMHPLYRQRYYYHINKRKRASNWQYGIWDVI